MTGEYLISNKIWGEAKKPNRKGPKFHRYKEPKIPPPVDDLRLSNDRFKNIQKRCLQHTPLWADLDKISKIYKLRTKMTRENGIWYHVDHIIPLRGKNVCGLHVENNLQIITKKENYKKGNRFKTI